MPTLLLEQAPALFHEDLEHDPRRGLGGAEIGVRERALTGPTDAHGRLTLDEILSSAWEGLAVRGAVTCPVCSGPMASGAEVRARAGAQAEDRGHAGARTRVGDRAHGHSGRDRLGGICLNCGSRLA